MVWVCVLSHSTPLQHTLLPFVPQYHLSSAIQLFNSSIPPFEAIGSEVILLSPVSQKSLSSKLDNYLFKVLLDMSSIADKARLLLVSYPHAASWLSVFCQRVLVSQFQVAIKW